MPTDHVTGLSLERRAGVEAAISGGIKMRKGSES
jgi:hypothetical protein